MKNVIWFEDYDENFELISGSRTIGEADIVLFASLVGLHEGLFLSDVDAAAYPFGKRVVPGIMTMAYTEGLVARSGVFNGAGLVFLGPQETRAIAPVLIGDTIRLRITVAEKGKVNEEKGRGRVTYYHEVFNQRDELVMTYKISRLIATRAGNAGLLGTEKRPFPSVTG